MGRLRHTAHSSCAFLCGALASHTEVICDHAHTVAENHCSQLSPGRLPSHVPHVKGPRDANILKQIGNQAVLFT